MNNIYLRRNGIIGRNNYLRFFFAVIDVKKYEFKEDVLVTILGYPE